jgi:hypothetical protein
MGKVRRTAAIRAIFFNNRSLWRKTPGNFKIPSPLFGRFPVIAVGKLGSFSSLSHFLTVHLSTDSGMKESGGKI